MMHPINLFGSTLEELQELCAAEGWPKFTARQMCDWLYKKQVLAIDEMTNLSLKVRARLKEVGYIGRSVPVDCQTSRDGTKKYLFRIDTPTGQPCGTDALKTRQGGAGAPDAGHEGGHPFVEAVMIPDGDRATLCISCQRGCRMGCRFCVTGRQGFHGNLSAGEILNQVLSVPESSILTNIVYMGMGEPMDNYDNVLRSTQVLTAEWGLGWSPRRLTVSSVGVTPMLRRLVEESECHVAVSLHNAYGAERAVLMPMERRYPVAGVVAMLKEYDWSGQRRISFEYTMFKGVNDDLGHAAELVRLLRGLHCRVNLIRFHESAEVELSASGREAMEHFRDYLNNHNIICTIRASRGEDIMAACGLLAGDGARARR